MKKLALFLFGLCLSLFVQAQVSKTVNCTAGNLKTLLTANELTTVTNLTLTGTIDARDFKTMRDNMKVLAVLDMAAVNIASYNGTEGTGKSTTTDYAANEIPAFAFCISSASSFKGKTTLTSVVMPSSATSIGESAFAGCEELTGSLTIPSSVTAIGVSAFRDCKGFTGSIIIPSLVIRIDYYAFEGCGGKFEVDSNNQNYSSLDGILYNKDQTKLIQCLISKTGSLTIPSSVTSIGTNAFEGCSGFNGTLSIPSSVTSIGMGAFWGCGGKFEVDSNNQNYSSLDGILYNKDQTTLIQCPFSKIGSLTIPSSVTYIEVYAFKNCSGFTGSLIIPSSVTLINSGAFWGCGGKFEVDSNNPNYSSSDGILYDKSQTTLIQCPISKIGSLIIPTSVKYIDPVAFWGCSGLTSIIVECPKPAELYNSEGVFEGVNTTNCILYVPSGTVAAYKAAKHWSDFKNIVEYTPTALTSTSKTPLEVKIENGQLAVSNIPKGLTLTVYNIQGVVVSSQNVTGTSFSVGLPCRGAYVVRVGEQSIKVVY